MRGIITKSRSTSIVGDLIAHVRMPLYRNAYALMLTTVITSGLGIVYWVLAARYYPTEVVGLNSALISAMTFVAGVSQRSLINALIRFIPQAGRSTAKFVLLAYLISVLGTAIVGPLFLAGLSMWSPQLSGVVSDPQVAVWFVLSSMAWCVFTLQDSTLTGLRQALWIPLENSTYAVLKLGLLVLFATSMPAFGILASWTLPVIFMLIPVNLLVFKRLIPQHVAATERDATEIRPRQVASYMGGDFLGGILSLASSTLLPVLVASKAGTNASAYFYLAWLVATSLQLVSTNMSMSLTVEGAANQTKLAEYSRRSLKHIAKLLVPVVLVTLVGASWILNIFGTRYAEEGATLLQLLALATLPQMVNAVYLGIARVQKRMLSLVVVQGAICAGNLGLSYVLLDRFDVTAVGWAVLLTQTVVAVVLAVTRIIPLLWGRHGRPVQEVSGATTANSSPVEQNTHEGDDKR